MPVIKGERIGESRKVNRRSVESQDFYALLVATVPDDFGRFRFSAAHVALRLYPRREPTPAILKRTKKLLDELATDVDGDGGLVRTWEDDGIVWGEFTGFKSRGNRWHRTPEPPWSLHDHQGACLSTAIRQARDCGQRELSESLSMRLNQLRDRGGTGARPGGDRAGDTPSPPSPPSPPTATEGEEEKARPRADRSDRPLFPDAAVLAEGHGHIRVIEARDGIDPVDVCRRASWWNGSELLSLESASSEKRLAYTVARLRTWATTGRTPEQQRTEGPGATPRAGSRSGNARQPNAADRAIDGVTGALEILRQQDQRAAAAAPPLALAAGKAGDRG